MFKINSLRWQKPTSNSQKPPTQLYNLDYLENEFHIMDKSTAGHGASSVVCLKKENNITQITPEL